MRPSCRASPRRPPSCARRASTTRRRWISRWWACRSISAPASAPARARARRRSARCRASSARSMPAAASRRSRCATSRDMGDAPVHPFDLLDSIDKITAFFKNLARAQHRADRRRRRPHDHAADPARPVQGRALRRRAFRRPCRHARHLSRHQDQSRHAVPPAGGGGHPRSQAHDPDRPARHALRRRRHPVRL